MKNITKTLAFAVLVTGLSLNAENSFKDKVINFKNLALDTAEIKKEQASEFVKNNEKIQAALKFAKNHKKKLIIGAIAGAAWCAYGFSNGPIRYVVDNAKDTQNPISRPSVPLLKKILHSPIVPLIRIFKLENSTITYRIFDSRSENFKITAIWNEFGK